MTFKPLHRDIVVINPDDWEDFDKTRKDEFYDSWRPLKFNVFSKILSPYFEVNKSVYVNQFNLPDEDELDGVSDDYDEELCTLVEIRDVSPLGIIDTEGNLHYFQTMHSLVFPDANSIYFDWQDIRWALENGSED
jgi:hypothetical protein